MAMDSKLVALIASEIKLSEPVAEYVFQGISVEVDLKAGKARIPNEQVVGVTGVTKVSYSEEIQRVYLEPVEAALVMKMQMELLKGLSTIDNPELQAFFSENKPNFDAPTPETIELALVKLVNWVKPPVLNMLTLFQPTPHRPSPVKQALSEVFKQYDLGDLKSLTTVQSIQESIKASLSALKPESMTTPRFD